jgi:hypothetical protein
MERPTEVAPGARLAVPVPGLDHDLQRLLQDAHGPTAVSRVQQRGAEPQQEAST